MMLRLQQAGMIPIKHILENEVSEAPATIIQDKYKMQLELVPPGKKPQKFSISRHTRFQGALYQYTVRHRTIFSAIVVGQAPTTGRNNNQPIVSVQCKSQRFGILPSERPV